MLWLFAGAVVLTSIGALLRFLGSGLELARRIGGDLLKVGGLTFGFGVLMLLGTSGLTFVEFYLPAIFASPWAALLAGLIAICLFALRKISPATYGAIEIAGAIGTLTVLGFSSFGSPFQRGISLITAAYFLIRGLDNAEKGLLHRRFLTSLRKLSDWRKAAPLVLIVAFIPLIAWLSANNRFAAIKPPFLGGKGGERLPVSAIECGEPFIVCDESAWRQHERLENGTAADRAQAEADANARFEYYRNVIDPPE
ncbi:hypothetical protein GCM10009087_07420 [Sphingomonas oligophenolica]|uniref:Uncharacterized protein n=1 Tax=Sphingomonas oligophenolica TaxID=301154 RepID=A0ABU9XXH2_9SPHN